MGDEPCDVGPAEAAYITHYPWKCAWCGAPEGALHRSNCAMVHMDNLAAEARKRHHPAGIEPPELYEQWKAKEREMARARERDLVASCPDVASYTQACRYMHTEPPKPQPEPFAAEGAVFGRLIGRG